MVIYSRFLIITLAFYDSALSCNYLSGFGDHFFI